MTEPTARQRATDAATVGAYRFGSLASRLVPVGMLPATAASLGLGISFMTPARRKMVERHLRRVNPSLRSNELRLAVQQAFDSYARYYVESFRLPTLSARTVDRAFSTDGFHHITDALELGKGCIFALPHMGGWEWAGRWMTDQGYRLTVVVEALQPPELFEWFRDLRSELGMTVVAADDQAAAAVTQALKENQIVCLLCDRDIRGNGVEVEFFGEHTRLPAGPAMLGLRTGAPVLPVGVYYTGTSNGHHAIIRPPLPMDREGSLREDVVRITQLLARELEVLIRRAPEQWHLFQPNWPSDPGYE